MIYLNVGEMSFIPMNIHNEQFNGVRQLRCSGAGTNFQQGGQDQPFPAGGLGAL